MRVSAQGKFFNPQEAWTARKRMDAEKKPKMGSPWIQFEVVRDNFFRFPSKPKFLCYFRAPERTDLQGSLLIRTLIGCMIRGLTLLQSFGSLRK